jgi:hypothetical protein
MMNIDLIFIFLGVEYIQILLHCKKNWPFSRPQPVCHLPNCPWQGIIKLFPARETSRLVAGKWLTFFTVIPFCQGRIKSHYFFKTAGDGYSDEARLLRAPSFTHSCWGKKFSLSWV